MRASKISFIAYGSDPTLEADPKLLAPLVPGQYALVIGRIVRENSILEIVRNWTRAGFEHRLAVVGAFSPNNYSYHAAVKEAAGESVHFLGPIYNKAHLDALRLYALFHIHGHRVGGTNPSLVEALGAGSPIIAHDNCFNRWVAGEHVFCFKDDSEFMLACRKLVTSSAEQLAELRRASRKRHADAFQWDGVLANYERVLLKWLKQ